jgi:hypothetical protein
LPHVESLVKTDQVGEVVLVRIVEPYNFSILSGEGVPDPEDIARLDAEAKAAKVKNMSKRLPKERNGMGRPFGGRS